MSREGELDPWTGQRAAFPLNSDELLDAEDRKAIQYIQHVREEARQLALNSINAKRPAKDDAVMANQGLPLKRPRTVLQAEAQLNYDQEPESFDYRAVARTTTELFGGVYNGIPDDYRADRSVQENPQDRLAVLYKDAGTTFADLENQHPEECTSLATWKSWTAHNWPVPLSHQNTFRLYKYLARWCSANPPHLHFIWAWSLLLRTPSTLSGDEISELRDLCKSMLKHKKNESLAAAFIETVGTVFGQADLLSA